MIKPPGTHSKPAMEFKIGNTRVKICTDYCENVTPEQVQKILDNIAANALQDFAAQARAKAEAAEAAITLT